MELISDYLETYEGRDKFLRTLSYAAKLITIVPKSKETADKFKYFGSQMSGCRVMLRLLDDIPSIHYAISYGWGKQEPDQLLRLMNFTQIMLDVVYSPVETICWLGEHNLVSINVDKWDNTSTWFWIISLYISLMKSLVNCRRLLENKKQHLESRSKTALRRKMKNEVLTSVRMLLDLSYAVSYLPAGTLWGGKLKTWHVGALGTASSLISLYQVLSKRASEKKST